VARNESTNRSASISKRKLARSQNKRYGLSGTLQFIEFANLLDPNAELPDPRELEPEGRHAGLLAELGQKFCHRFRPRRVLSRKELDAASVEIRSEMEADPRWKTRRAELRRVIAKQKREAFGRSRQAWSEFADYFTYDESQEALYRGPELLRLYRLFFNVRRTLRGLADAGRKLTDGTETPPFVLDLPPVIPTVLIGVAGKARTFYWNEFYDHFMRVFEDADVGRIRVCPACGRLYWANPSHKGACDQHLGLERVRRHREKQHQYEEVRKLKGASN